MYLDYCIFIPNIGIMLAFHIFQDNTFDLYLTTCVAMLAFRFFVPIQLLFFIHLFLFIYYTTWWKCCDFLFKVFWLILEDEL
jgi:hypothetical protein